MTRLWNLIDDKNLTHEAKIRIFILSNCLMYSLIGLMVWLLVSRFALSGWNWALCFAGYPGFFIGLVGGFIYLCRK